MANIALKTSMKTDLIQMISGNLSNSNRYYFFVSKVLPYEDESSTASVIESDSNPPSISESTRNVYDALRSMLFLKRIQPDNIRIVVPRYDWTSGTAYTAYSETTDMADKTYYVMTSDYNVYKCLKANNKSVVMPTGKSANPITTADGYVWKYIYTVPEDYLGFITLEYIPVFIGNENTPDQRLVESTAKPGSIDRVFFNSSYSPTFSKAFKYSRFCTNIPTFYSDTGRTANIAGSSYITFEVLGEATSPGNSYWNDYGIHVTDGEGKGQYFRIINFHAGGVGNSYYYANVYPNISRSLVPSSSMVKVVPYLVIDGDGEDASIVPTTSLDKKISNLSIVKPGINYTYAQPRVVTEATDISLGTQVSQFNDTLSTSLSIPIGHGANAIKELGAAYLMVAVDISGTEGGKINTRNDYRQFGIVKNPLLYGGLTLAGDEEVVALKAVIKKEATKKDAYSFEVFKVGNYILGKETGANAKILGSERIPSSNLHRLYLTDVSGNFRFSDPQSNGVRVYFETSYSPVSPLVVGEMAYQHVSNGGITLSAQGKVRSFDMSERTLVVDTLYGAFQSNLDISFASASTLATANILEVDQENGEMLGQFVRGYTSGSQFLQFGGNENFGWLASTSFVPTQVEDIGEYRAVTRINVQSSGPALTDKTIAGSNAIDGTIRQTDSTSLKLTTADVVDFVVPTGSGSTGTMYLTNVTGYFNSTDRLSFIPYGTTAETSLTTLSINSILPPEVEVGSGELLYIENVRPIERNVEQSEEFKVVIGF